MELHERTVGKYLAALGYRRLSVRPRHPKADPEAQDGFQKNFREAVAAAIPEAARGKPLEVWFQDEARVGQQGTLTRVWAKRGTRPRAPRDTRYQWAYIFGAVCPERGVAAGLVMPFADTARDERPPRRDRPHRRARRPCRARARRRRLARRARAGRAGQLGIRALALWP